MFRRPSFLLVLSLIVAAGCGGGGTDSRPSARFEAFSGADDTPIPTDLSRDGAVVAGYDQVGDDFVPLFWRNPASAQPIRTSDEPRLQYVTAISRDGGTVLGASRLADGSGRPVVASLLGARSPLPLPDGANAGYPVDLSGDGSVALCTDAPQSTPFDPRPYVVRNGVATYLPLPDGTVRVRVSAISADGSTVVGDVDGKAIRWVDGGAPEVLAEGAGASAVSGDGSVVVGTLSGIPTVETRPFRWTAGSGVETLPTPAEYPRGGQVQGVSDDGKTVLIDASDPTGTRQGVALLWKEGVGTRLATDLFVAAGGRAADVATLASSAALSGDGKVILGRGERSASGILFHPWKLTLP